MLVWTSIVNKEMSRNTTTINIRKDTNADTSKNATSSDNTNIQHKKPTSL